MAYKILISTPYMQKEFQKVKHFFKGKNLIIDLPKLRERLSEQELLSMIEKYDGVICGNDAFTSRVFDKAKKLKVIVKWGIGIDSIDVDYAKKLNIPVYNTPGAFTETVSDTVIGFILSFARNIPWLDKMVKKGKWGKIVCYTLSERVLGIVGVGNIGQGVAKRAQSFGMKILGNDIKRIPKKITKKYNIKMVSKAKLFSEADYISLNCSLTKTSYQLITMKYLKMMKKDAVIINTSRGSVVKEKDLITALKRKMIGGAALDVFEQEPLPKNSPLKKFNNVLLSPHNASSSPYFWQKVHENSIKKLFEGLNIK